MPRPKVLDDGKKREICALVTAGMSLAQVARYVGCHRTTIYNERQQDPEFEEQMRRAGMRAVLNPLEAMRRAASTHWRAAAWLLDRQERREAQRGTHAARFSRDEVVALGEQVKELVHGVLLCPIEGPQIEQKIENLFVRAEPGGAGKRSASRQPSRPSVEESVRFLEQLWADRTASMDAESKSTPDDLCVD